MLETLVMAVLEESNGPLTAYDIADRSHERGQPLSATQVYRVLDRLASSNKIQRIELLSAWLALRGERQGFLVCRCCRSIEAFPLVKLQLGVDRLCRAVGFTPSRSLLEVSGLCGECAEREAADVGTTRKRKETIMIRGVRALLAAMTTLGTMVAAAPAEANERRPGVLYDRRGAEVGTIAVTDAPKGVVLRVEARDLPPGWHGMHFHEKADCSDAAFVGAGGHVHSEKPIVHGFLVEGANDAGDLPNIHVHADGTATVELYSALVSLHGRDGRPPLRDGNGSALVIHASPDDYTTQPIGGAGERIACAVIP